jgi:HlyD family secretion protein
MRQKARWTRRQVLMLGAVTAPLGMLISLGLFVDRSDGVARPETALVRRGDVVRTLAAEGSIESARNAELLCQVDGGSTILWIVPDGTQVQAGDELVRFDSSAIEEKLSQQLITVERAKAAKIAAEHELLAARLALPEYVDGTFVEQLGELEANRVVAGNNLALAEDALDGARRLARRGFITQTQLAASRMAVEQAELQLEIAVRAEQVLRQFNKPRMVGDLSTRLQIAEALVRSTTAEYELSQSQVARSHEQIEQCVLRAPQDGLAIYANDEGRKKSGTETPPIELGAFVHKKQTVLRLPDLSQMQARVLVHESAIMRVRRDQPVIVRVRGHEWLGQISDVANQPERTRRSQQHIKHFAVTALIDQRNPGLRPGESAEAELLLDYRPGVLRAPKEAVVRLDDGDYTWVWRETAAERRRVRLGAWGDRRAEVLGGLREGEEVVLNPRETLDAWQPAAPLESHTMAAADLQRTSWSAASHETRAGRSSTANGRSATGG